MYSFVHNTTDALHKERIKDVIDCYYVPDEYAIRDLSAYCNVNGLLLISWLFSPSIN
jgi:hypothetical protein